MENSINSKLLISLDDLKSEDIPPKNLHNVQLAFTILLKNNPNIFKANSPEEVLTILGLTLKVPKKKGKWAAAAKRLSEQNTISSNVGKEFEQAISDFRETFAIGDDLHDQDR